MRLSTLLAVVLGEAVRFISFAAGRGDPSRLARLPWTLLAYKKGCLLGVPTTFACRGGIAGSLLTLLLTLGLAVGGGTLRLRLCALASH